MLLSFSKLAALDLRPTISPFSEDGTNIYFRVSPRNMCIGAGPTATDALSLCTAPVASATRALFNLSNTALAGGSAAGTYIGANPAICTGDFFNFQLADVTEARLTCAGVFTVATYTGQTSIVTLGTVGTGTWQATKVGLAYGGTNADLSATGGSGQIVRQNGVGAALTVSALAANPAATVSGLAVNGVATTAMRSDAAPALANTAVIAASYGSASAIPAFTVDAQGRLTAASTSTFASTNMSDSTISTFTITSTNFTVNQTGTARYTAHGNIVALYLPFLGGTSNSTLFTFSGVPVAIRPARLTYTPALIADNGTLAFGYIQFNTDGTASLSRDAAGTPWTASGTKNFYDTFLAYTLQ